MAMTMIKRLLKQTNKSIPHHLNKIAEHCQLANTLVVVGSLVKSEKNKNKKKLSKNISPICVTDDHQSLIFTKKLKDKSKKTQMKINQPTSTELKQTKAIASLVETLKMFYLKRRNKTTIIRFKSLAQQKQKNKTVIGLFHFKENMSRFLFTTWNTRKIIIIKTKIIN